MRRIGWFTLILVLVYLSLSGCAVKKGLVVENPWARTGLAGNNSAVFFRIDNASSQADALRGASGAVAASVEVHQSKMENGVMKMQPQESVEVPANQKVEFKPGGYHVMLVNLKQDLKVGDRFELTLQFDKAGAQTIQVTVQDK